MSSCLFRSRSLGELWIFSIYVLFLIGKVLKEFSELRGKIVFLLTHDVVWEGDSWLFEITIEFEVSGIYLNGQKIVFEAMENMWKLVNEVSKTMACK